MKKTFLLFILFLSTQYCLISQNYLTGEVITKVLNIKIGKSQGSSFIINHKMNNYLITAKHVLGTVKDKQKLNFEVYQDSIWKNISGIVLLHKNPGIDIAIIDLQDTTSIKNNFGLTIDKMTYGDEGYFLGFPYGLKVEGSGSLNSGFPIPFVKKAILSAFFKEKGIMTLFLDGQNNPGFSGGPIIFGNSDKTKAYKWNIIGVVSAYKAQNNELVTPFGRLSYHENSGIMVGYGINHVFEILEKK